jgi:hypothetical protein
MHMGLKLFQGMYFIEAPQIMSWLIEDEARHISLHQACGPVEAITLMGGVSMSENCPFFPNGRVDFERGYKCQSIHLKRRKRELSTNNFYRHESSCCNPSSYRFS